MQCMNLKDAAVAQLVERVLGKDEVTGPSPVSSFPKAHVHQEEPSHWRARLPSPASESHTASVRIARDGAGC